MNKSQKFGFYLPAWNETARALNWRMKDGRLAATCPQWHGSPEATALMHEVWRAAEMLALKEHRAVTPTDLKRGVTLVRTGHVHSDGLNTTETTRVVTALDLLKQPEDLDCMNCYLHPEIAEQRMAIKCIEKVAFNESYVAAVSSGKFRIKQWRNLKARQLWQLLFTLVNRARGKAKAAA